MTEFQVHKKQLTETRLVPQKDGINLAPGEIRLKVDAFSFTANNITYWAMGDKLAYWQFFPASDNPSADWGIIPVWGFADVTESQHEKVTVGERLFGYFPTATEWIMQPSKLSSLLWFDGSKHRAKLPVGYNMYRRVNAEPDYQTKNDALRMLLFPLHITSFCIHDMLKSQSFFGAEQVLIISASSKTSLGLAFAIQQDTSAPSTIGLTSSKNAALVDKTGYFQSTATYDDIDLIDFRKKTVIVDMSGNGQIIAKIHAKLKDNMLFSSHVGLTHWDETGPEPGFIEERSKVFFAPSHIQQRYQDWGAEKFEQLANEFMQKAALDSSRWLEVIAVDGLNGLTEYFNDVSQGQLPANQGLVVKMSN